MIVGLIALILVMNVTFAQAPGSIYSANGPLAESGRDLRANRVDDLVTVVVSDTASAVSRGSTNTSRKANAKASIGGLLGSTSPTGRLANLADLGGESELQSQGETSRSSVLTTTLTARVTRVLPNGNLEIEGLKEVMVNSERQQVVVRGMIRTFDVGIGNTVRSDRIGNLSVQVNGKGVVGDAIRRPNFLYRLLLGVLPF